MPRARVLADVNAKAFEAGIHHCLGNRRRRSLRTSEQSDPLGAAYLIEQVIELVASGVGKVGFVPILLDPRKRQLHCGNMRQDIEPLLAEALEQKASDAKEQRIAFREDGQSIPAQVGVEPADQSIEVVVERATLGGEARQHVEDAR